MARNNTEKRSHSTGSKKSAKRNKNALTEKRPKSFLSTWSIPIICFSIIVVSPIVIGGVRSLKVHANNVKQWLPKDFQAAQDYDWFVDQFGVDEMVAISWEECKLSNPKVDAFCRLLRGYEVEGKRVFERAITANSMISQIRALGVSDKNARERIQGLFIGPDREKTCILAFPSTTLNNRRTEIVKSIYDLAETKFDLSPEELRLGGPTVDAAAIDMESRRSLDQFMWITVLIVFLLSWYRLKDFLLASIVLVLSVGCAFLSLSILYWTGGKMNLTMIMLPTLTFILGISASIHMANYYRKAVAEGYGWLSADQALQAGAAPISMAAITTAIGLASLGISKVIPIRMFGIYAAIGILASLPIILLLMPSVLFWFRGRVSAKLIDVDLGRREKSSGLSHTTSLVVHQVCRHHWWVTVPGLILLLSMSTGISRMRGSVDLQNRFSSRTKIMRDYQWLEDNLGALVPLEVVIRFGPENELSTWQQMLFIERIQRSLTRQPLVSAALSASTFKPLLPRGNSFRSRLERRIGVEAWQKEAPSLADAKLIHFDGDAVLWRISLRVTALENIDYGKFLDNVEEQVNEQLGKFDQPDVSARFTGGIPLFYHAQHQILDDLTTSFLTAFIFISLVLIFVLRSLSAGLLAMLPNVFPPLIVFGAMGWLDLPIEIGSVMTASVALGIAVDDTIHFLTWYRRGVAQARSRMAAIRFAIEHCAKPMIDTTIICAFGVAAFMFSDFMPTVRFSRLLFILLMAALVGDLLLLPAMLAGPAGTLFRRRTGTVTS